MSRRFETALDDCMELLRAGASVEDCLSRYSDHADELRPLVSLASAVISVPTPRPDAATVVAHRNQMLDAVRDSETRRKRGPAALRWVPRLGRGSQARSLPRAAFVLTIVVLLLGIAGGTLFTATRDSLPGQGLYPLKRLGENIRLSLTLDPVAHQQLRAEYRLERQREVRLVLETHQQAVLEFRGELQEIGSGFWVIGGLTVHLDNETVLEGQSVVGAMVLVQASALGDGRLRATRLQALTDPIVLTPAATVTPTTTPSKTPTMTSSPRTTETAIATPTATPMPSEEPTATPAPSATPTMTASPWPTATPTLAETEEPEPTDHPEEDETDEPDSTDHVDEDAKP